MNDHRRFRVVRTIAFAVCLVAAGTTGAADQAATGKARRVGILNAETWESAKGLLPDEFLARYRDGEWWHEIWEPAPDTPLYDADFIAAGKRNAGRYAIGAHGEVVEVATGKQPPFIYGPPFPEIDPADPKAGAKAVWNFAYQSYLLGNTVAYMNLEWVGTNGRERRLSTEVHQRFFDGQPPRYRPRENPQNFLFQQLTNITRPADLQGTVSLTHRFRDPTRRDQVWTYVPALRRVRAVSPVNRSDGFLGSDMSQDDGSYFDGKPEDFEWKLVGEGEVLAMYDRKSVLEGVHAVRALPEGGFMGTDPLTPRFAYQLPESRGLPWRPLDNSVILIRRPVWIVEGIPKDKYYLYGKLVLRFDKESWRGTYNSKYSWTGEIVNSYLPLVGRYFLIGEDWRNFAWAQFTLSQNWKMNRATTSLPDERNPSNKTRIAPEPGTFSVNALMQRGK